MYQRDDNAITPVILSGTGATPRNISEERFLSAAEVDREGLDVGDTLIGFAILLNWTVKEYKTQFLDCWDVRRFGAMSSDGRMQVCTIARA